jgi:hypothetical protein
MARLLEENCLYVEVAGVALLLYATTESGEVAEGLCA